MMLGVTERTDYTPAPLDMQAENIRRAEEMLSFGISFAPKPGTPKPEGPSPLLRSLLSLSDMLAPHERRQLAVYLSGGAEPTETVTTLGSGYLRITHSCKHSFKYPVLAGESLTDLETFAAKACRVCLVKQLKARLPELRTWPFPLSGQPDLVAKAERLRLESLQGTLTKVEETQRLGKTLSGVSLLLLKRYIRRKDAEYWFKQEGRTVISFDAYLGHEVNGA